MRSLSTSSFSLWQYFILFHFILSYPPTFHFIFGVDNASLQICDLTCFPKGVIFLTYKLFQTVSQIFPVLKCECKHIIITFTGRLLNI